MTPADTIARAYAALLRTADGLSPVVAEGTRAALRAHLARVPGLASPVLTHALASGRVAPGARWPSGAEPPGTCDP